VSDGSPADGRKVQIVVDGACDLPDDLLQEHRIEMVRMRINFEGDLVHDRTDASSDEVLRHLATGRFPKVSQPSPGEFLKVYGEAVDRGLSVISIHVTARLTGTFQSARLAAELLKDATVDVVDTRTGSMATGWVALMAARAALAGADHGEVLEVARRACEKVGIYIMVPDLIYLNHAGRLGKAQAWLGTVLNMKPLITGRDGVLEPVEVVRGRGRALRRLVQLATESFPAGSRVAVVHVAAEDDARQLLEAAQRRLAPVEGRIIQCGPAVTYGLGPGAVGICLCAE